MSKDEKEQRIRQVYYNEDGFGSVNETYKESKQILNSITINDVKEFMQKQTISQLKSV